MRSFRLLLAIIILTLEIGSSAFAITEVCGDGVDNDASGGDALCPTDTFTSGCVDKDRDGFCLNSSTGPNAGIDCDDTNRYIFPDAAVGSQSGCSGNNAKVCQASGVYGSCSSTGFCPSDCSTCYYISPTGSDGAAGTFAAPWLTPNMFSDRGAGGTPAGYTSMSGGRCFLFRDGSYTTGSKQSDGGGTPKFFWIYVLSKTATAISPIRIMCYPGETCTVTLADPTVTPFQERLSSYVKLSGNFRFTANSNCIGLTNNGCLNFEEGSNNEIYQVRADTNSGFTGGNMSGFLMSGEDDIFFHHLLAYDNIGTNPADNNNSQIVTFRGKRLRITDSVFYYTTAVGNRNVKPGKHANFDSSAQILRNVIINGDMVSGYPNLTVENNFLLNSTFQPQNVGGPTHTRVHTYRYNTVKDSSLVFSEYQLEYNADNSASANVCSSDETLPPLIYEYNVVAQSSAANQFTRAAVFNNNTPESTLRSALFSALTLNNNLYYNSAEPVTFGEFEGSNATTTCASGALGNVGTSFSFANWKISSGGKPALDTASFEENPNLVTDSFKATSINATGKGWTTNWGTVSGAGSTFPLGTTSSKISRGGK